MVWSILKLGIERNGAARLHVESYFKLCSIQRSSNCVDSFPQCISDPSLALGFELAPREPLKRTRRGLKHQSPVKAVNGSRDEESDSEDEGGMLQRSVCLTLVIHSLYYPRWKN